jgi:ubiquinone/menaquinone biosynthesis C-methylase UbiE
MTKNTNISIVKPTESEKKIWEYILPKKTGGVVRQGSAKPDDTPIPPPSNPPDKNNPDDWDDKMKGGPRAEWWAYMMEGAHRILDVGCGGGFPSFYLATCGFEVVGVDPSPSEINRAKRHLQQQGGSYPVKYQVIEQTALPFEDDSFDGTTFSSSLECVGDPEALMREVIRVLKPGSPVAVDEEDRGVQPKTHPVWEDRGIVIIDDVSYLWVGTRVCEPYLDRRYMIRLSKDFSKNEHLDIRGAAGSWLLAMTLEEAGLSLEQVLSEAIEGEYGEAQGYDPYTLRDFLEKMGFTDLKFWTHNDGFKFAKVLQAAGVLADMPDDIRAVSRALVESIHPLSTPTTLVSCKSP